MADIFERYRYVHPDGTAKDWAVRDNGDGTLTTRWGKAGDRLPQRHTRPYRHPGEVNALIRQKRNKGYCPLDRVRIDKHGRVSAASAEDTPKTEDAMYWEVHFIASGEEPALQRRIARLIDTLARYACVDSRADPPTLNGWAVPSPDNRAGQLRPPDGVWPLLFLMALRLDAPEGAQVAIADEDGREIGGDLRREGNALAFFGADLDSVRDAAEALGLLAPATDFSRLDTGTPDFYF